MAATTTFKLSLLMSLLSILFFSVLSGTIPSTCKHLECPSYDVVEDGKDYEIRRFNSAVWMSTASKGTSLVGASNTAFLKLFAYIKGNNTLKQKLKMTAPVITEVSRNDSSSLFVVSFYVPKVNQGNPPSSEGLKVQRWKNMYAAVRQFGGFVTDYNIVDQVEALKASIAKTKWASAIKKSHTAGLPDYTVAQYNAPFELLNRVNEIWFLFPQINVTIHNSM